MNETRRKPTAGRQSPSLFDKWHRIFYMASRIYKAGHTKAFDYPVAEHWGESRNVQFRRWDSNRQHMQQTIFKWNSYKQSSLLTASTYLAFSNHFFPPPQKTVNNLGEAWTLYIITFCYCAKYKKKYLLCCLVTELLK